MSERIVERVVRMRVDDDGNFVVRSDEEETGMREEIVRCRDCGLAFDAGMEADPNALHCIVMDGIMAPYGFCSLGERRDA